MRENLHILFALRPDYQENPGGDTVQMEAWLSALQRLGYQVSLSNDWHDRSALEKCSIVFIWHLERVHESFRWWELAVQKKIPVVLIPTYWHAGKRFPWYSLWKQLELTLRCCLARPFSCRTLFYLWSRCRKRMLTQSQWLIVNSNAERDLLISEGADARKIMMIPNVASASFFLNNPPKWEERNGIVCIGHFCPRKNQLALIRALKDRPVRITFIGGARPMHKRYMNQCIKTAAGQHEFLGRLSHEETLEIIKKSRYAISASLAETPGIANLEAAAAGCGLILPALAPIQEYFYGCPVHYIEPHAIDSAALERMLSIPPDFLLQNTAREKYTEEHLTDFWNKLHLEGLLQ